MQRTNSIIVLFAITLCVACDDSAGPSVGTLRVSASTTGTDVDADGYSCTIDDVPRGDIGINQSLTLIDVPAGEHEAALTGIAANCVVAGDNPRTVTVLADDTVSTEFLVSCASLPGNLEVRTQTGGDQVDRDGYTVSLDGVHSQSIGVTDAIVFSNVAPGDHTVEVTDVAGNCAVADDNPRTVRVHSQTSSSTLVNVTCWTLEGSWSASSFNLTWNANPAVSVDFVQHLGLFVELAITDDQRYTLDVLQGATNVLHAAGGFVVTGDLSFELTDDNQPGEVLTGTFDLAIDGIQLNITLPNSKFFDFDQDGDPDPALMVGRFDRRSNFALLGTWTALMFEFQGADYVALGVSLDFTFDGGGSYSINVTGDQNQFFCESGTSCTITGTYVSTSTTITFEPGTIDEFRITHNIAGNTMTWTGVGLTATFARN